MDAETVDYSAPGKIILFGEHAVVYGYPAIVMAINRRAKCRVSESHTPQVLLSSSNWNSRHIFSEEKKNFVEQEKKKTSITSRSYYFITQTLLNESSSLRLSEIHLDSDIPLAAGLGSSAAIAVSMIASLSEFLGLKYSLEQINALAFEAEKVNHGNPSGVDNTISTFGGIQLYKEKVFKKIPVSSKSFCIVVANSNITRNTREFVEKVSIFRKRKTEEFDRILSSIEEITLEASSCLSGGDLTKTGELMSINHSLLEQLGVSHPTLSLLRQILQEKECLGSKMTGAGGGGCVIGLYVSSEKAKEAVKAIEKSGYQAFITDFTKQGVRRE